MHFVVSARPPDDVGLKDAKKFVVNHANLQLRNFRVRKASFNSPIVIELTTFGPAGWIAIGLFGVRYVIYVVGAFSRMRAHIAENRLRREAVDLLRDTMVADLQNEKLRKVLLQQALSRKNITSAADALVKIDSAVDLTPSDNANLAD
jgi:hypothetical protein